MTDDLPKIGDKYLVTTNNWFTAPDGATYLSVFGTIKGIVSDTEMLGIQTNRHSTNWYLKIGDMIIAGCQIFFAIKTDNCSKASATREIPHEGKLYLCDNQPSRIYFADESQANE